MSRQRRKSEAEQVLENQLTRLSNEIEQGRAKVRFLEEQHELLRQEWLRLGGQRQAKGVSSNAR